MPTVATMALALQSLFLCAAKKPKVPAGALMEFWIALGVPGRVALIGTVLLIVAYLIFKGLRRLSARGRRSLLWGVTGLGLLGGVILGIWVTRLPTQSGSFFVFWHQLVRGAAVLSTAMFVLGAMALALPLALNRTEKSGFVGFLAARHIRSGRSGFLTAISILSILGVLFSSFGLCVVISVMGGFGSDLKRKILGNNAHIRVDTTNVLGISEWEDTLANVRLTKGVDAATPIAGGEVMASSHSNTAGVQLKGIDPASIGTVIELLKNIEVGQFEYLTNLDKLANIPAGEVVGLGPGGVKFRKIVRPKSLLQLQNGIAPEVTEAIKAQNLNPGVILGRELAKSLNVMVGDEVRLVSPIGELGPGGVMPRNKSFRVAAIFYSGMYEYDASHAYVTLPVAQNFLDLGNNITAFEVRVVDENAVRTIRPVVEAELGRDDLRVRDWEEMNKNLFSALKLEKIVTFIILCLAVIVASFCILSTLLLMVTEKSKEIAIMKALGATDRHILSIFMSEGMIIGGIGTLFGVVSGLVVCLGLQVSGTRLDPDVYYVDKLPIHVDPVDYSLIALAALVITTLATIYPAIAAASMRPVDGIRHE